LKKKEVTHFTQVDFGPYEQEQYRSFFKSNWDAYNYDGVVGHLQSSIDWLRCAGYTITKKGEKDEL